MASVSTHEAVTLNCLAGSVVKRAQRWRLVNLCLSASVSLMEPEDPAASRERL